MNHNLLIRTLNAEQLKLYNRFSNIVLNFKLPEEDIPLFDSYFRSMLTLVKSVEVLNEFFQRDKQEKYVKLFLDSVTVMCHFIRSVAERNVDYSDETHEVDIALLIGLISSNQDMAELLVDISDTFVSQTEEAKEKGKDLFLLSEEFKKHILESVHSFSI